MSKHPLRTLLYWAVTVLFTASIALAQKGKTIDIYTNAVLPNGKELKAGKYQVVVDENGKQVKFMKGNKVVAEAPCKVVEVPVKNDCNKVRYSGKGEKQEIQELNFGGERRSILLIGAGL